MLGCFMHPAASYGRWCRLPVILGALGFASHGQAADLGADTASEGALTAGSILVRGRLIGSIPVNQHSRIDPIGGRVIMPTRALPDLDVTYFLTDHFAVAGQSGVVPTRTSIRGSAVGNLTIGTTWSASMTGTIQFHVFPHAAFNPYVGAGTSYTRPLAYEPAKPLVTTMKAEPQVGPMIQVGFDYHLGSNWYANAEVKQIFLPTQVSRIGPGSAAVKLNMLIVGVGLGYRF